MAGTTASVSQMMSAAGVARKLPRANAFRRAELRRSSAWFCSFHWSQLLCADLDFVAGAAEGRYTVEGTLARMGPIRSRREDPLTPHGAPGHPIPSEWIIAALRLQLHRDVLCYDRC